MEKVLGVILFIILGFWLMGIIGKWFLRYWIIKKQRQMEEQMRSGGFSEQGGSGTFGSGNFRGFYSTFAGNPSGQQKQEKKKEGEVTIEKTEQPKKGVSSQIGEYVDFEEVK